MKKGTFALFLLLLIILAGSCSFQHTLKSNDVDRKYETAMKLYNTKDYSRALQLFDQLVGLMRATDKSQKIYYCYAYCYYNQKDFTLAAYYFKRFYENFPNTKEAEECHFMEAYCYFMNSPEYGLDQTSTTDAIRELQVFTNIYPQSPKIPECNDLIDNLRAKLEKKDYRMAKLYYRMDDYLAAITVLNDILKEYPDTRNKEDIMFLVFKATNRFAMKSIESRKKERYLKAISAYNDFVALYPKSDYLREANEMLAKSKKELDQMKPERQKFINPNNN
jgi:outer membrane protein assembly factor BamD